MWRCFMFTPTRISGSPSTAPQTKDPVFVFKYPPVFFDHEEKNIVIMLIDANVKDSTFFKHQLDAHSTLNVDLSVWPQPKDALCALREGRVLPDVIVLDLMAMGTHGRQVFKALQIGDATQHLPLVIYSSLAHYTHKDNIAALDPHAFFPKPLDAHLFQDYLLGDQRAAV